MNHKRTHKLTWLEFHYCRQDAIHEPTIAMWPCYCLFFQQATQMYWKICHFHILALLEHSSEHCMQSLFTPLSLVTVINTLLTFYNYLHTVASLELPLKRTDKNKLFIYNICIYLFSSIASHSTLKCIMIEDLLSEQEAWNHRTITVWVTLVLNICTSSWTRNSLTTLFDESQ